MASIKILSQYKRFSKIKRVQIFSGQVHTKKLHLLVGDMTFHGVFVCVQKQLDKQDRTIFNCRRKIHIISAKLSNSK